MNSISILTFPANIIPPVPPYFQPADGTDSDVVKKAHRILLVEDNPADVALLREALNEHGVGCDLVVMTDGESAIQYIDQIASGLASCPEMVVLDLNLPKRNGREVLQSLRSRSKFGSIPVVILSSSDAPSDRNETARLGATRYIRKPSRLDDFLQIGAMFKEMLAH